MSKDITVNLQLEFIIMAILMLLQYLQIINLKWYWIISPLWIKSTLATVYYIYIHSKEDCKKK